MRAVKKADRQASQRGFCDTRSTIKLQISFNGLNGNKLRSKFVRELYRIVPLTRQIDSNPDDEMKIQNSRQQASPNSSEEISRS